MIWLSLKKPRCLLHGSVALIFLPGETESNRSLALEACLIQRKQSLDRFKRRKDMKAEPW